jgi:hypothetical protein
LLQPAYLECGQSAAVGNGLSEWHHLVSCSLCRSTGPFLRMRAWGWPGAVWWSQTGSWLCSSLDWWASGLGSTKHFPLHGGSPIKPSSLPCIVRVSPDHWPLPGWKAEELPRGSTVIPPPLPRHSVWHPRSTDATLARRMSSPKMSSFVILATNTQISLGAIPGSVPKKLPPWWQGLPPIPSVACSVGSVVFWAIWRRCWPWRQSRTPWCWW